MQHGGWKNPRDPSGSLDFARDFACGLRRPQARLNFDALSIALLSRACSGWQIEKLSVGCRGLLENATHPKLVKKITGFHDEKMVDKNWLRGRDDAFCWDSGRSAAGAGLK